MNDDLPLGWVRTTLGDVCSKPQYGWTTSARKVGSGLKLLRTSDISGGTIDWTSVPVCEDPPADPSKYQLHPGDIVVSRAGSVGISHVVRSCPPAVFASYLIRLRPLDEVSSEFIALFLKSPGYWQAIAEEAAGIAVQNVNATKLGGLELPLPPFAEQQRIATAIEALLQRVNAVRERLANVGALLKRFRLGVLAAACRGRLTTEWRGNTSSPSVEGIASDTGGNDLPRGWRWRRIDEIGDVRGGIQKQPKRKPKDNAYPYLRVGNVLRGKLDLTRLERMELFGEELRIYRLVPGDLLIVEGNGSLTEIGRSAIWGGEVVDCVHQNHIIRVRPTGCVPEYLNLYWNSPEGTDRVAEVAVTTAGLYSLSTGKISGLPVPVPPIGEQKEIVARVRALFVLAEAIEQRVRVATVRAERLLQAVSAKGFRGELVPTEAELARKEGRSYESADELLLRIVRARSSGDAPLTARRQRSPHPQTDAERGRRGR